MKKPVDKPITRSLKKALRLIQKGWTKGAYARDKHDRVVPAESRSAVKWCLQGALDRADPDAYTDRWLATVGMTSRITFNDQQKTKEPVIVELKRLIGLAEEAGI